MRIDPKLFEEIEAWAHQDFRSVNGQVEFLLREAVRRRKGSDASRSEDKKSDNS
ncbi:hypothetical protein VDG1235_4669 [Verrucomicrobiia bacterium DG1235]|nr:hypothetical protein VDG1235_4669 [Verrucomicrobiae bacterium DG1235]